MVTTLTSADGMVTILVNDHPVANISGEVTITVEDLLTIVSNTVTAIGA